jgi:hypothetical protein
MRRHLLAIVLLFGAGATLCSAAGYLSSASNHFARFTRFHSMISPEANFRPTARQVRALALEMLDRSKINVVVGGSSVMFGVGQPTGRIWTQKLAELLGDDYRVINLATKAGDVAGLASFTTEMLSREGFRVIYVTDLAVALTTQTIGTSWFEYFYWDAKARGYLYDYPSRDRLLNELKPDEQYGWVATVEWLNSFLNFNELRNFVSYKWINLLRVDGQDSRPRQLYADPEIDPPQGMRYGFPEANLDLYIHLSQHRDDALWPSVQRYFEAALPDPIRKSTIVSLCLNSPGVSDFAPEAARQSWSELETLTANRVSASGAMPLPACDGFTAADYVDRVHLSISGGEKLAARVANAIRKSTTAGIMSGSD